MTDDLRPSFPTCEEGMVPFLSIWPDTGREEKRRICWRGGYHEVNYDRCRACKEAEKGEVQGDG
jgi:hypothetical protein